MRLAVRNKITGVFISVANLIPNPHSINVFKLCANVTDIKNTHRDCI